MVNIIKRHTELSQMSPFTAITSKHSEVSVVIPCLNCERSIAALIFKLKKYVNQIIVVDDGSSDLTAEKASKAGAIVLRHKENRGKGAAMKTGVAFASGNIIVFIDGDSQHQPSDIQKLIKPILDQKAVYVIGSRFLSDSRKSSAPFCRKISNIIAASVFSFLISFIQPIIYFFFNKQSMFIEAKGKRKTNSQTKNTYKIIQGKFKHFSDCTSGFIAMKKDNWEKLDIVSDGFQIETEMLFEHVKNGFIIAEVPICCEWGNTNSQLSIFKDSLKTLIMLGKKLVDRKSLRKIGDVEDTK